jgi:hypothetical protein
MSTKYETAKAEEDAALARLTETHWKADSLVHIGRLDIPSTARRLGTSRSHVLEMLAQVTDARELCADADVHRPKPSAGSGHRGIYMPSGREIRIAA